MGQQRQPDRYERRARDRLEPILGPLRCIDPGGGPEGAHDFEADLDDGGFAAIEVTGEVESGHRVLESLVRRLPPVTVPGSRWRVQARRHPRAPEKRLPPRVAPPLPRLGTAPP